MKKIVLLSAILLAFGLSSCTYHLAGKMTNIGDGQYVAEVGVTRDYFIFSENEMYLAVCQAQGNGDLNCEAGEDGHTWFDSAMRSVGFGPDKAE